MDKYKKIGLKFLYPHILIVLILFPLSIGLLIWSMLTLGTTHVVSIISYVFSFYALTILCLRIPDVIRLFKKIKTENKFINKYIIDKHMRLKLSLIISLSFNFIYAIFQFFIGLYHGSFWFYSMSLYYFILSIIRFFLSKHILNYDVNEDSKLEYIRYLFCGWMMLFLNVALSAMVIFMVVRDRTFNHHEITTIALAAYTFTSFTVAIVSYIKYKQFNSPVYRAAKSVSLTSACVSIITLEATMLTSFGSDMDIMVKKLFLGLTGGVVSAFVIFLAINIIVNGSRKLKDIKLSEIFHGK